MVPCSNTPVMGCFFFLGGVFMKRKNQVDGISMQNFVSNYLGTQHSCSKLKHQGLKSFNNPYVIGVSNDFALKYPDCVMRQELLVVIDDYGNPGTYINPINIQKLIELEVSKEKIKLLENITCYNFEEIGLLYQVWIKLINDIKCLDALYDSIYELLYLTNKVKILRNIRKYATEEAKRTLLFTKVKTELNQQDSEFIYENEFDSEIFETQSEEEVFQYMEEEPQITTKVNRQKRLNYKAR